MIIHSPEIRSEDGQVRVSARIELQTTGVQVPDTLWFRFPETYGKFSTGRADGFAASLLLLGMLYGEDMDVRGILSPRLVYGMQEYQRIFHSWLPKRFKLINVKCHGYESPRCSDHTRDVGCAFSGGVDSFYTLWSHLPQNESKPGFQISHALFVHGYDIALADEPTYCVASQNYSELMRNLGLNLVTAQTNIYHIVTPTVGWEWAHGSALIGVALNLDRLLARFYVPSTHTYSEAVPWGSDPRLDYLLSTETLEIIHDGAAITRTDKTATVAQWPETYPRLRVCWEKPDGIKNCCRCSKCIRTMTTLDLLGVLSKYTTFPIPLASKDIRSCKFFDENERNFAQQVVDYALTLDKKDMVFDLRYALFQSRISSWADRVKSMPAVAQVRKAGRRVLSIGNLQFGRSSS